MRLIRGVSIKGQMRLVRGDLQPKVSLSHQFQWHQVTRTSNASLRPVLIETSNPVHGSNMQHCGRSYSSSAPSDALEPKKPRRRVSKDERRSMVEDYVNKYRAMNAGKFPTVSDAKKDLGGSFYVLREILQELKYNSKISFKDTTDTSSSERISAKEGKILTDFEEIPQPRQLDEHIQISKTDMAISSSAKFESKEGPQSSTSIETVKSKMKRKSAQSDKSRDVGTQSDFPTYVTKRSPHADPEININQETLSEDKHQLNKLQPKAEPQESNESEILRREMHKTPSEHAEPQMQSSLWQNLKSFASGIFGKWRS